MKLGAQISNGPRLPRACPRSAERARAPLADVFAGCLYKEQYSALPKEGRKKDHSSIVHRSLAVLLICIHAAGLLSLSSLVVSCSTITLPSAGCLVSAGRLFDIRECIRRDRIDYVVVPFVFAAKVRKAGQSYTLSPSFLIMPSH